MNIRRILLSLFVAGGVLALGVYGTRAFFNDTETSTGNRLVAGDLDLKIDSTAHYAGMVCGEGNKWDDEDGNLANNPRPELVGKDCTGTWDEKDLAQGDTFFSLADVKPGDQGENTLSIHVASNDAWLCADVDLTSNNDNSSTEPELSDLDVLEDAGNNFDGELAQNVKFTAWLDQGVTLGFQNNGDSGEGDNIWQGPEAEPLLFTNQAGPASDVLGGKTYALADSTTGTGPIIGGVTNYIGLQWCLGDMAIVGSTISCDGSLLDNKTQTDSFDASLTFRAVQHRNNPSFKCERPVKIG